MKVIFPNLLSTLILASSLALSACQPESSSSPKPTKKDNLKASPEIKTHTLKAEKCGNVRNLHVFGNIYLAGQPQKDDFKILKERGLKTIINMRTDGEINFDEKKVVEDLGLKYVHIPYRSASQLTDAYFDNVRKLFKSSKDGAIMVHCGSANRVGALWLVKRTLDDGLPYDEALKESKIVGLRSFPLINKAKQYIEKNSSK